MAAIEVVVIGASAGGIKALEYIFGRLDADFPLPVLVTRHVGVREEQGVHEILARYSQLPVAIAMDKEIITPGAIYLAPADYHMQVEEKGVLSLGMDEQVCYACPAIDVLFESTARVYGPSALAVLLSGANSDGAEGIKAIRMAGGITVVQSPETADMDTMPKAAIKTGCVDHRVNLEQLPVFLKALLQS